MAESIIRIQCVKTDDCKQLAIVNCVGCSRAFCTKHLIEHRHGLNKDMDAVISEHDHLQQTLREKTTNSNSHLLNQEIDEWEKESIEMIHRKAEELRQQLRQLISVHFDQISEKLQYLKKKLEESRNYDNFVETDLQGWRKSLDEFKASLTSPSTFSISRHVRNPSIENVFLNLFVKNELFERVSNNKVRIEGHGQVAIHDASETEVEIRGKNEYTSGCHEIRLRIGQSADRWTFLGVNSKSMPLQDNSYGCKSAFGWASNNSLWQKGEPYTNISTGIEMKTNDRIILIFDCDSRKIFMTNERTNGNYVLDVNIEHCPFPWQLHANLYQANSSIYILST